AVKGDGNGDGACQVDLVDGLNVDVRFGRVAAVPARGDDVADAYPLPHLHTKAAVGEVAQCDDDAVARHEHVVPCEGAPAPTYPAPLRQRVSHRGQSPVGLVIGVAVVCGDDDAVTRGVELAPESGERPGRLRKDRGAE